MNAWRMAIYTTLLACCLVSGGSQGRPVEAAAPTQLHSWVVYWDETKGWQEVEQAQRQGETYQGLSYFALSFTDKGKLHIPPGIVDHRQHALPTSITVVNDVVGKDKMVKDTAILRTVLQDTKAQRRHSDDLIKVAKKYGYTGIEVDYEQVFKDPELVPLYTSFLRILYERATANHLAVRVILEPKMVQQIQEFPPGPTYVVMAYNLYGTHSGPGPKADFAFITKTIRSLQHVPKPWGIAFSSGGCLWSEAGKKQFVSTTEAVRLANVHHVTPTRDVFSGTLSFTYTEAGVTYTVWYSDEQTIKGWMDKARAYGIEDISLWRLGEHEYTYTFTELKEEG